MISEAVYLHYMDSLLNGDKETCAKIVEHLIDEHTDVQEIYTKLFKRSLHRIGDMWEKSRCCVSTEHMATRITQSMIELVSATVHKTPKNGKSIVVTCVDKEFHEIGPQIVADYFSYKGWESFFLGANVPCGSLLNMIETKKPDLVGISNNFYINITRLFDMIREINETFPNQKIIIGGQAVDKEGFILSKELKNVTKLSSLSDIDDYIEKEFNKKTTP